MNFTSTGIYQLQNYFDSTRKPVTFLVSKTLLILIIDISIQKQEIQCMKFVLEHIL
jgi:hypothetical protein